MVLEVAIQDPLKPCTNHRHGFVPSLVELFPDRGQRCAHTLLGRQPDDLEFSLSVRSTTMREPEEVERLWFAQPSTSAIDGGAPPELDQPRLVRVQLQSERRQPLAKLVQEPVPFGNSSLLVRLRICTR